MPSERLTEWRLVTECARNLLGRGPARRYSKPDHDPIDEKITPIGSRSRRGSVSMLKSADGFISVHHETRERKRKSPRSACASEASHQHYYPGESRVYSYTPIISRRSKHVKAAT